MNARQKLNHAAVLGAVILGIFTAWLFGSWIVGVVVVVIVLAAACGDRSIRLEPGSHGRSARRGRRR